MHIRENKNQEVKLLSRFQKLAANRRVHTVKNPCTMYVLVCEIKNNTRKLQGVDVIPHDMVSLLPQTF